MSVTEEHTDYSTDNPFNSDSEAELFSPGISPLAANSAKTNLRRPPRTQSEITLIPEESEHVASPVRTAPSDVGTSSATFSLLADSPDVSSPAGDDRATASISLLEGGVSTTPQHDVSDVNGGKPHNIPSSPTFERSEL